MRTITSNGSCRLALTCALVAFGHRFGNAGDRILFEARQAQRLAVLTRQELHRQHAHANQVRSMDALEAFGDHGAHTQQQRAFGGPIARRSRAVLLARDDQQRRAFRLVLHRGVVDEHLLARWNVRGPAAFGSGREHVAQPDVGQRSAHHHFMVAAARAIGIEIARASRHSRSGICRPGCRRGCCRRARCDR